MKDEIFDQPQSLLSRTLLLLEGKELLHVYRDTGLSFYWLRKLVTGAIKNPSVNRIQFLYEHLTGKDLNV